MEHGDTCACKNYTQYLWIDRSKTTQLAACTVIAVVCIFGAGFFLGKHKALKTITEDFEQQAFSDQVHHSLMMLYGKMQTDISTQPALVRRSLGEDGDDQSAAASVVQPTIVADAVNLSGAALAKTEDQYYAQIGKPFYVLETAQRTVAQLQKKGITSTIVKRTSTQQKTKKVIPWYQVTTQLCTNEGEVHSVISNIKKIDSAIRVSKPLIHHI